MDDLTLNITHGPSDAKSTFSDFCRYRYSFLTFNGLLLISCTPSISLLPKLNGPHLAHAPTSRAPSSRANLGLAHKSETLDPYVPPNPKSRSGAEMNLPAPLPSPTKSRPPGPKSHARHRLAPSQIPARPVSNLPLAISYPPLPSLLNPSLPLTRLAAPPSCHSPTPSARSHSS